MYKAADTRYDNMTYRRCGESGVILPAISLGMWQNFGGEKPFELSRAIATRAFDMGILHFDLANNYGPPAGSAEETMGRLLANDLAPYRDELIISTKAGYDMWAGPYGEWGSKKYLTASLDQSLKRMGLEYVDIFYSHRFDPNTPLEETMEALAQAVRSGKALYVGVSNYSAEQTKQAVAILKGLGVRCLIHQPHYSMLDRWIEGGLTNVLAENKMGCIAFSPLEQGLLTSKYLKGVPQESRAAGKNATLSLQSLSPEKLAKIAALNSVAESRGQSLAQMAIAWVLRTVTSVVVGVSRPEQLEENVAALSNLEFDDATLLKIEEILRA